MTNMIYKTVDCFFFGPRYTINLTCLYVGKLRGADKNESGNL